MGDMRQRIEYPLTCDINSLSAMSHCRYLFCWPTRKPKQYKFSLTFGVFASPLDLSLFEPWVTSWSQFQTDVDRTFSTSSHYLGRLCPPWSAKVAICYWELRVEIEVPRQFWYDVTLVKSWSYKSHVELSILPIRYTLQCNVHAFSLRTISQGRLPSQNSSTAGEGQVQLSSRYLDTKHWEGGSRGGLY